LGFLFILFGLPGERALAGKFRVTDIGVGGSGGFHKVRRRRRRRSK